MTISPVNPYRLSDDVLPRAYRLVLSPDLDDASFTGTVEIDLDVIVPVESVVLNAVELTIHEATISVRDQAPLSCTVTMDEATERAVIDPGTILGHGRAVLSMRFSGILNDDLAGFYRSTFTDPDGISHTIATTQMEATDARRAFPCFDEPAKKATFTITLIVPEELAAFSNGAVISEELPGDGTKIVSFSPTMVMSTYLVAFVVGPFEATEPIDVDGVPVRIVYPPGKADLTAYALESAEHSLRYFTSYFDIPYPGDKLDLVAIPDFAFGAMENLGCITFRETALLVDPATASHNEVERVASVIGHELAHMWFGDLVTMGWWEGIWLNEAFATFMEVKCTDAFRPEWECWVSFAESREAAMVVDGLHSTRPIEFEVISPADARGMFDVLTYEKGGSVLRMLEQFMGEESFRRGIRTYLTTHSYSNTVTNDLWDALETATTHPVRSIMNTWILQGGHPVLTVESGAVSQTSFSYGQPDGESAIGDSWLVPMMTRSLHGEEVSTVVLGREPQAIDADTLVNAGGWGFYRTSYGTAELARIAQHLDQLDAVERTTLVFDIGAAALAGHRTFSDFLTLAHGLGQQIEPVTWADVAVSLAMARRFAGPDEGLALAEVTRQLFTPLHELLGWDARDGEAQQAPRLRSVVLLALGTTGRDETVRAEALRRFEAGHVEGDLASTIISIVGEISRPTDFDELLKRFQEAKDPQAEQRYLFGLARFNSRELTERAFHLCLTETVRTQDAPYLVSALLANRDSGARVFDLLVEHWDECLDRFPTNSHNRMVSGISSIISSADVAKGIDAFLTDHPVKAGQRSVLQSIERMWTGVSFAERERPALDQTLRGFLSAP